MSEHKLLPRHSSLRMLRHARSYFLLLAGIGSTNPPGAAESLAVDTYRRSFDFYPSVGYQEDSSGFQERRGGQRAFRHGRVHWSPRTWAVGVEDACLLEAWQKFVKAVPRPERIRLNGIDCPERSHPPDSRPRQVQAHPCRCASVRWHPRQPHTGQRQLVLVVSEICAGRYGAGRTRASCPF